MFSYNFKYELKSLLRSKWLVLLTIILLTLVLFAGYNGKKKVNKRVSDIEKANNAVKEQDIAVLKTLDSIEKGLDVNQNSRSLPTNPMNIGYSHPRVAAMYPQETAFIATGQSDLFTHYVQPKAYGDSFFFNHTELSNPIQLLFGSFDLAFVIIYILPLIIIAFSYHIFSLEKENGSLKLMASQPISIYKWILQKTMLRFFVLSVIVVLVLTIAFIINNYNFAENLTEYLYFLLLTLTYMLFWFTVVLFINIKVNNSAKNAVSLLAIWVFIILIIPAIIAQAANTFYPIPSRTKMITEVRALEDEVSKKQDKILDNFLRDHPEYASNNNQNYSFCHQYLASQDLVEDEVKPLVESYETQLLKQQKWVKLWQYSSPAIILQQSFNDIAGTSTTHYQQYRSQVAEFSTKWRDFFVPLLYNNEKINTKLYKQLPTFEYKSPSYTSLFFKISIVLIMSVAFLLITRILFYNKSKKGTIIN